MKKVCVQGMGFVGAAMATSIAMARDKDGPLYDVVGIDLPNDLGIKRIEKLNKGLFPFNTPDRSLHKAVKEINEEGNFFATSDEDNYSDADIIVVDIPLNISYLEEDPELDFSLFLTSLKPISHKIKKGCLLLIETTVPPGTCEKVVIPFLEEELTKRKMSIEDINVAHSYERVMPGENYLASIREYWRVFSGFNPESSLKCKRFLESIIDTANYPLTELDSMTASETAKVLENSYRAVNIAFIDEWTKFSESVGIDLVEIIEAIKIRSTHSNIMLPGLGVGGYCLTKDPTFAKAASKQIFDKPIEFPFSKLAVKVNNAMPNHVVDLLKKNLKKKISKAHILVCGISYRPDVSDTRFSATEILVNKLLEEKAEVFLHDPNLSFWDELSMAVDTYNEPPENKEYDAIIMCVSHKEYSKINFNRWFRNCGLVIDANCVFNSGQREALNNANLSVHYVGRS